MTTNFEIDLNYVPDWHVWPSKALLPFGSEIKGISVEQSLHRIEVSEAARRHRQLLEGERQRRIQFGQGDNFRPGELASVESVSFEDGTIRLRTGVTDFFDYLANSSEHRDNQGRSRIRPLAVQATLFTPDERIIIDQRSKTMTDFPGAYSVFGGSLTPDRAANPEQSLKEIGKKKWRLELTESQLTKTGLEMETVNLIICLFFLGKLTEIQASDFVQVLANRTGGESHVILSASRESMAWENFTNEHGISVWNPTAFTNILYALVAAGFRTPQEAENMVNDQKRKLEINPFVYTYPMEKYLPAGV